MTYDVLSGTLRLYATTTLDAFPSTKWASSMIETNALPLSQTTDMADTSLLPDTNVMCVSCARNDGCVTE